MTQMETTALANGILTVNVYTARGLWRIRLNYEETTLSVRPVLDCTRVSGASLLIGKAVCATSSDGYLVHSWKYYVASWALR